MADVGGYAGRFGRLFPELPSAQCSEAQLAELAASMHAHEAEDPPVGTAGDRDNPSIPAGYTYLGRLIANDLTFDSSPRLALEVMYGRGPKVQPQLYHNGALILGERVSNEATYAGPDLPRDAQGRALIPDARNDENKILSQLHCLFARFHNAVLRSVNGDFETAQHCVRWHYQFIVVNDYLARVARPSDGHCLYGPEHQALIPAEFAAAAFCFDYSMVRDTYLLNDRVLPPIGYRRFPIRSSRSSPTASLNGFAPLPKQWGIEWKYFFDTEPRPALPQASWRIDELLCATLGVPRLELGTLPVAEQILRRGLALRLPSGQAVANCLGETLISDEDLFVLPELRKAFQGVAPLWYYILREANVQEGGARLGRVGSRIVHDVLYGLVENDEQSYLRQTPSFQPLFCSTMAELVRFVADSESASSSLR